MQISADKAGRKARCPNCDERLVIPTASQQAITTTPPSSQSSGNSSEEDEEGGVYNLLAAEPENEELKEELLDQWSSDEDDEDDEWEYEDEEDEEAEERMQAAAEARKERVLAMAEMRKAPIDEGAWRKVRIGILIVAIGMCIWCLGEVLNKGVLLTGLFTPSGYSEAAFEDLIDQDHIPTAYEAPELDKVTFYIGLLGGRHHLETMRMLLVISYVCFMIQLLVTGVGYGLCLFAPNRFVTRPMVCVALGLAVINLVLMIIFRLVPVCGGMDYVLIQLVAPELCMQSSNIARVDPVQVTWSTEPFTECFIALILHVLRLAEPIVFCVFLRGIALQLKEDWLIAKTHGLIRLGLGLMFAYICYLLLTNTGTSQVLINLLRLVYFAFLGFFIWYLNWYLRVLFSTNPRIIKKLKYF